MGLEEIKFDKDIKVLVTGCAGFIGSNLLEFLLKKNLYVRGLDNLSTGSLKNINKALEASSGKSGNSNFDFINGDIRNPETCKAATGDIDIVFHEAALGSVQRSIENPLDSNSSNIDGTLNMLFASHKNNVRRFIYASSSSVYGDTPVLPKVEDMPVNPKSIYAVTKLTAEYYTRLYYNLYGLETVSLRYFNVFGERQSPDSIYSAVIPLFLKKINEDSRPVIFGDGEQSRDFSYIDNVVYANCLAATSENKKAFGNFYNVACGKRISLNEIIRLLSEYYDKDIEPVYKEERKGDVKHSLASLEKIREDLGYSPLVGFKDGLAELISKF